VIGPHELALRAMREANPRKVAQPGATVRPVAPEVPGLVTRGVTETPAAVTKPVRRNHPPLRNQASSEGRADSDGGRADACDTGATPGDWVMLVYPARQGELARRHRGGGSSVDQEWRAPGPGFARCDCYLERDCERRPA
jgi:hypothetical protein